ncbi:hypothetical protein BI372_02805 [Acinetobacter pittii]|nr:hypothetical protein BI372_02805 [Acinetobacter pittii]
MIPNKFIDFIKDLRSKTINGELIWEVYSDPQMVEYDHRKFNIRVRYYFDEDLTTPFFYVYYTDKMRNQDYVFNTSKYESDYFLIEDLFANAQASDFQNPW